MSATEQDEASSSRADAEGQDGSPSTRSESAGTSDIAGEDAEPSIVETPEQQLESARREAAENYERFVRAKADLENVVKRHQRELSDRARYDGERLAREILQPIDDLERALEHSGDGGSGVSGGVELVLKELLAALKRNGVERVDAQGKPFDPSEHEAVAMVESSDVPPNTVISVFRAGYKMRDRLLRPAMVSVSKAPEAKA
jgi:molecular chaperone GrpE